MVGTNSKVGIINIGMDLDDDLLAEISEEDYLAQLKNAASDKTGLSVQSKKPVSEEHICNDECGKKFPIHRAADEGDLAKFKEALGQNLSRHMEIDCRGFTVLHCIAYSVSDAIELFEVYEEECRADLLDKNYLDQKDNRGLTALHIAALWSLLKLMQILLNLGATHNLVSDEGEIPLATALFGSDAYPCVEFLLNLADEDDLEKFGPRILFNAVHSNDSPESIELLLSKIKFKGLQEKPDEDGNPGLTLLHKSVYWAADDDPIQIESLRRLVAVLDKEDMNALCERRSWVGKTALHLAAEENAFNSLNLLVANEHTDLFIVTPLKRTILHTLADYANFLKMVLKGWSVAREQSLKTILNSPKLSEKSVKVKFLEMKDEAGETALELAVRRDSVALSRTIILAYPDPPEDWLDDILMKKIYEKVPEIMIPLMNLAIKFEKKNYEAGDEQFESNLGPVIGYGLNEEAANYLDNSSDVEKNTTKFPGFKLETDFLAIILDSNFVKSEEQATVLGHPLVALFIHEKWKKLDELFWFSFGANMTLLAFYTLFVVDIFWFTCTYKENDGTKCTVELWKTLASYATLVAQLVLLVIKLIVDFLTIGFKNMFSLVNLGQLLFTIGVAIIVLGVFFGIQSWHHWVASTTVLLASFLAFSQLLKIPSLGIYADIFYTVLQKMIRLMITFCPLLIGFTVAISLILPGNPKFAFLPFNFIKILIMMTGEMNFDDVFYADYETPFKVYAILLFAFFAVIVAIVIFNLLLGFTISDIQTLEAESEVKILASTLGQIVVFERLVLSKLAQKILPKLFLRRYLVVTHKWNLDKWEEKSSMDFSCTMEVIPTKLRKRILELAKDEQQQPSKIGHPKSD